MRYFIAKKQQFFSLLLGVSLLFLATARAQETKKESTRPDAPSSRRGPGMKGPAHDDLKLPVPRTFDLTHVEPVHYAAALGKDPQRIFEFVRDHVAFESYSGCLRGPRGTLLAMSGNSVDRAALLGALLKKAGHSVRFAKGELPEAKAKDLVQSMWGVPPVHLRKEGETSPAVKASADALLAGVKRDFKSIRDHLKKAEKAPAGDPGPSLDALIKEARDHYWVQLSRDGAWVDLDPSFADAAFGQAHTKCQDSFAALPDSLFHRVTMRIRVEESAILIEGGDAGKPASREILSFAAKAADLSGRDVILTHMPENWKGPARDVKSALSTAIANTGKIKPVLLAGPTGVVSGTPFYYQLPTGKGIGGIGGLLGGAGTRNPIPIATAESIEFEFVAPGGQKETVIREIFDRVGPARRATGKDLKADEFRAQLALKENKTAGLLSLYFTTGRIDMAHFHVAGAEISTKAASAKKDKLVNIRDALRSAQVSFLAISDGAMARLGKESDAVVRYYPDSPRLHIAEWNSHDQRFAIDLRRDRVRAVAPGAPAGTVFHGQVLRGIVEGSLERAVAEFVTAELVGKEKWGSVISTGTLFERAHADGVGLVLIDGDRPLPQKAIPDDARARMKRALAGGNWVIMPERALALGGRDRIAWWQVDPRSGETSAVTDDGLHGAGTAEKGATESVVVVSGVAGAEGFVGLTVWEKTATGALVFSQAVQVFASRIGEFLSTIGPFTFRK